MKIVFNLTKGEIAKFISMLYIYTDEGPAGAGWCSEEQLELVEDLFRVLSEASDTKLHCPRKNTPYTDEDRATVEMLLRDKTASTMDKANENLKMIAVKLQRDTKKTDSLKRMLISWGYSFAIDYWYCQANGLCPPHDYINHTEGRWTAHDSDQ